MSTEFKAIYCFQSFILLATDCQEDAWEEWFERWLHVIPTLAVLQSPTRCRESSGPFFLPLCYLCKWTTVSCLSDGIVILANVNFKILGLHSLTQNLLWLWNIIIGMVRRRGNFFFAEFKQNRSPPHGFSLSHHVNVVSGLKALMSDASNRMRSPFHLSSFETVGQA